MSASRDSNLRRLMARLDITPTRRLATAIEDIVVQAQARLAERRRLTALEAEGEAHEPRGGGWAGGELDVPAGGAPPPPVGGAPPPAVHRAPSWAEA